jgi:D-amino-acid dehydrogenase
MKVVVLGAGVVGVAAAYFLARAGAQVTVIERAGSVAQATSYANGGQLSAESAGPWANPEAIPIALGSLLREDGPFKLRLRADPALAAWVFRFLRNCTPARARLNRARLLALGLYSRRMLSDLLVDIPLDFDHRTRGILELYREPRAFEREKRAAAEVSPAAARVLSASECVELEPALAERRSAIAGGIHYPQDASGDARRFTEGLAAALERRGVRFEFNRRLRALRASGTTIVAALTDDGACEADAYVLALGCDSAAIVRPLGLRLPIYPVKGYSVTLPVEGASGVPEISIGDEARKIVIARLGARLRAAGTAELAGYDLTLNPVRARAVLSGLLDLFPRAGDPARAEFWAGLRPMTPDGAPILGATAYRNLFLDTGHGTLGWTLACGSGRLVADLATGHTPEVPLAEYGLERF